MPAMMNGKCVMFWDWDDTLLCSSVLSGKGYRLSVEANYPAEFTAQLKELEASVISVLSASLRLGEVHIVTNAENRWVELSAKKWLPGVVPFLEQCQVISARSTFEVEYPKDPRSWKTQAFRKQLLTCGAWSEDENVQPPRHVFSLGDSDVERRAMHDVAGSIKNCCTKSIKFSLKPSIERLRLQHAVVLTSLVQMVSHGGNLDLCILENSLAPMAPLGSFADRQLIGYSYPSKVNHKQNVEKGAKVVDVSVMSVHQTALQREINTPPGHR